MIVAGVPESHIAALIEADAIKQIVDHEHYNPRIIQWMTEADRIGDTSAGNYPSDFLRALDDPQDIWDKAFRTHIPRRCQHLLIAMFISSEYGAEIEDLREVFEGIHPVLCKAYSLPSDPKDFEEALRTLEGSFVTIANGMVWYINPSVHDYIASYLNDKSLLSVIAEGTPTLFAARNLYDHFMKQDGLTNDEIAAFVLNFLPLCDRAKTIPVWKQRQMNPDALRQYEKSYSDRLELLITWWRLSGENEFLATAQEITEKRGAFSAWHDGRKLPPFSPGLTPRLAQRRQSRRP